MNAADLELYRTRTYTIQAAAARLRLNRHIRRGARMQRLLERWAMRWCRNHDSAYAGRLQYKELPILSADSYPELLVWWRAVPEAGDNREAIEKVIAPDPEHFSGFVNIAERR